MNIEPKKDYNSNIFIFKQNKLGINILIPINEKKEININQNEENKFNIFIKNNNIKSGLISINNYIYDKNSISFNNLTLFHISKCEYIDEFFQKQLINKNNELKKNSIFSYIKKDDQKPILDSVLLKVIEMNDNYFLGIDHIYNIYKVCNNNKKIIGIDLYKLVLIKNFIMSNDNNIFDKIILSENSYVYIFENSFKDSILNDLTVLYLNIIDFKESLGDNLFNENDLENKYIYYFNYNFKINKKSEYFIINTKNHFFYNYYPITIKLINDSFIHSFKITLYYGILNKINCSINNNSDDKYSLDYFYYNYSFVLPEYLELKIGENIYIINDSDTFNSKTRKRFVIINIPGNIFTTIYKEKKNENKKNKKRIKGVELINNEEDKIKEENKINKVKEEKNKIKEEIKIEDNDRDIIIDNIIIEKMHDSLQLCLLYKNKQGHLMGIYDIEEILFQKNVHYITNNKFNIFYGYFEIVKKNNNNDTEKKFLNNLNIYKEDKDLEELVKNKNYDFSNIKYEDYYLYINLCLYYYMNKTIYKRQLVDIFEENYNKLFKINLTNGQKIRIMKFTCEEFLISLTEKREPAKLLLIPNLPENNSYKIALNYCRKMICELTENSKLYLPLMQSDNYILFNYYINSYSYTLSMEPLTITKKHLLSSYEDFLFTYKEKEHNNSIVLACQYDTTDLTAINEFCLFPSNQVCASNTLTGEDLAVPIVMELLHKKNHSKKDKKNKRCESPLYFYKKSTIYKTDKDYQDNKKEKKDVNIKGEDGLLIEYFIKYKKQSLVKELKFNICFGKIIKDVKFFTSNNFQLLYEEINNSIKNKEPSEMTQTLSCIHLDEKKLENKDTISKIEDEKKDENNNNKDLTVEYYEKNYLWQGKYFIYPDSFPYTCIAYNNKDYKIPQAKIEFINKYEEEIENGRKKHYH